MMGTSSVVAPRPAQALVGLVTSNVALAVIGGSVALLGIGVAWGSHGAWGWGVTALGIVLLDQNGQVSPKFREIAPHEAGLLGLSPAQMHSYNSDVSELNAVSQRITDEALAFNTPSTTPAQLGAFIDGRWEAYRDRFVPETFEALQAVRAEVHLKTNHAF
jgi:hypothetical protein